MNFEDEFDAFRELLPDELFKEAFSKVVNQVGKNFGKFGGQAFRPAGRLQILGERAFQTIPKAAAAAVGARPSFPVGLTAGAAISAGQGARAALGQTGRLGLGALQQFPVGPTTRILSGLEGQ